MKTFLDDVQIQNLTSNEQIVLQYFKDNLQNIIYLSLNDICKELYVSTATIVRFCQKVGFKGFNELKFQLKSELNLSNKNMNAWDIIPHRTSILKDFIENVDDQTIEEICNLIKTHKSIYIYGRNMSSLPAKYLYAMLNTMDIPCIFIDWIDFLSALSKSFPKNAILFIFTNYGEKEMYASIVKQCHERKIQIIWISSRELDSSLLSKNDIYIPTHEPKLEAPPLRTKLTSFLLVQLIVEYLRHKITESPSNPAK